MPPRDPVKIQLDFPLLTADLISDLRLTGTIGVLDFAPVVLPVYIVGDRDLTVDAVGVQWLPGEIVDGIANNPAASAILVDTGALAQGIFDIQVSMSGAITVGGGRALILEHRNAANAATLNNWSMLLANTGVSMFSEQFAMTIALNERLRVIVEAGMTGEVTATIMFKARPAP